MDQLLLIIGLLIFPGVAYAGTADDDSSLSKTTWFWTLLGICLALVISVPFTLILIVYFCYHKKDSDDSDGSSIRSQSSSSSSSSLTPAQRRSMHRRHHHHSHPSHSHYVGAFRSPPPPYTISGHLDNTIIATPIPPPYEPQRIEDHSRSVLRNSRTTNIQVQPAESTGTQSSTTTRPEATVDTSSSITPISVQTFQV